MTDQEINIAIAEACGWKIVGYGDKGSIDIVLDDPQGNRLFGSVYIPRYTTDLNAMYEAEEVLLRKSQQEPTDRIWSEYRARLEYLCGPIQMFRATARQRAEAFLRTVGKWKE